VVGTAQYIAPEQAQGLEVDARSDLYALGCCLYEMVTGQVPFTGPTPVAIAYRHVREDPTPPRALNPDVPVPLERVCLKAMAKRPEDRYQTAAELQRDLERVRAGEPVTVVGPLPSQQATQALGAAGYGEGATSVLGGATMAGGRAARHGEGVPEQGRNSVGWVLAAILALVVVGFAAFLITRAVTSPTTTATTATVPPDTTIATTAPPTTEEQTTTSEQTTTTTSPPTTQRPTTTRQPTTTTTQATTTTTQATTTTTKGPPTTAAD
jgi:serine/threonine-protein kinase